MGESLDFSNTAGPISSERPGGSQIFFQVRVNHSRLGPGEHAQVLRCAAD